MSMTLLEILSSTRKPAKRDYSPKRGPIADAVCAAVFNDDGDDWVYWFNVDVGTNPADVHELDTDEYRLMDAFWLDRD